MGHLVGHAVPSRVGSYASAGVTLQWLRNSGYLRCGGLEKQGARDGSEAIEYLFQSGRDASEMPCLVLLDLNMSRLDGFGVLKKMREAERTRFIPVVMLTSSDYPEDVRMAYVLGANSFLDKPPDGIPWHESVRTVAHYWVGMKVTPHSLVG
jgi:CheY-like chemotaxis protein